MQSLGVYYNAGLRVYCSASVGFHPNVGFRVLLQQRVKGFTENRALVF